MSSRLPTTISKNLRQIPIYHRRRALLDASSALTDYFHTTHSLPFSYASTLATTAPLSLSLLLAPLPFRSPSDFPTLLRRRLAFRPVDALAFFRESVGMPPEGGERGVDEGRAIGVAGVLAGFGFPWGRLGRVYEVVVRAEETEVRERLGMLEEVGIDKACLVAVCLAFPDVLTGEMDELLFVDMKCVFGEFGSEGSVEENLERYYRVCKGIRIFYDAGCKKGEVGQLLRGFWNVLVDLEDRELEEKVDFLGRLGMKKGDAAMMLLKMPEFFKVDLQSVGISMPEYLVRAGLSDEMERACKDRAFAMGRNKLVNLPGALRALGMNKWFMEKTSIGDLLHLLQDYLDQCKGHEVDENFKVGLASVKESRKEMFLGTKLEFLQGIGFGENMITIKALKILNGTRSNLQERFDCLLATGIEYSELCGMVAACPKILNHSPDTLRDKVDFLCNKLGFSVRYLVGFPAYLNFHLESRIKPRYMMLKWLREKDLLKKDFAPATVISTSEKQYIAFLKESHPAVPKFWLEVFKFNNHSEDFD